MPVSGTNKRESKSHPMCMFLANTEWSGDDARRAEISSLYPKTLATRPLSGLAALPSPGTAILSQGKISF